MVLLNNLGGYSLGKTLRLLFFLMTLNFYRPFEVFSLFKQYFFNYLLWLVEPVLSFFFLLSIVCFTNYRSNVCGIFKRELLKFLLRKLRFFELKFDDEPFISVSDVWAVRYRLVIYKLIIKNQSFLHLAASKQIW